MIAPVYELQLLATDETTVVSSREYPNLAEVARAMVDAGDKITDPALYDENGELTMRVLGAGGRPLKQAELDALEALTQEFGGVTPSGDNELGRLRLRNPRRRS